MPRITARRTMKEEGRAYYFCLALEVWTCLFHYNLIEVKTFIVLLPVLIFSPLSSTGKQDYAKLLFLLSQIKCITIKIKSPFEDFSHRIFKYLNPEAIPADCEQLLLAPLEVALCHPICHALQLD